MNELVRWIRLDGYTNYFYLIFKENNTFYKIGIIREENNKSVKLWIDLISNRKKSKLDISTLDSKDYDTNHNSDGGIKALLKVKKYIEQYYLEDFSTYFILTKKTIYVCIGWWDSKRRNVYSRLLSDGYEYIMDHNKKILRKKITLYEN